MSPTKTHALVLSAISLLLLLNSPLPTTAKSKLVESICNKLKDINHSKCVEYIEFDQRSSSATNLHDLAKFVIEEALTNATDALNYINEMAKKNGTEPIKRCATYYEGVVYSFKNARNELDVDINVTVYYCLISSDYSKACETTLAESRVKVPSISSRNNIINFYGDFLTVLTDKLG